MKDKYNKMQRMQVFESVENKVPVSIESLSEKIRFLRKALGLTQKQMAGKLGVSQPTYVNMEKNISSANISTIKRIAGELNCGLQIVLSPAEPFDNYIKKQAQKRAKELLDRTRSNMALEEQDPGDKEYKRRYDELVEELCEDPKLVWGK